MALSHLQQYYPYPEKKPEVSENDQGWFFGVNEEALAQFLNKDTKIILELGSWLGKSTRWMLERAPNAHIICVDHWCGAFEQHTETACAALLKDSYDIFIRNMWAYRDRVIPVKASSEVGIKLVEYYGAVPNLIYIDAAHDFINVKRDFSNCLRIFPDAQIVGDDFQHPPVRTAVETVAKLHQLRILYNMMALNEKVKQGAWWVERQRLKGTEERPQKPAKQEKNSCKVERVKQ